MNEKVLKRAEKEIVFLWFTLVLLLVVQCALLFNGEMVKCMILFVLEIVSLYRLDRLDNLINKINSSDVKYKEVM